MQYNSIACHAAFHDITYHTFFSYKHLIQYTMKKTWFLNTGMLLRRNLECMKHDLLINQ